MKSFKKILIAMLMNQTIRKASCLMSRRADKTLQVGVGESSVIASGE